ncbi:WhiB family transcriptional regulator [Streptomyces pacificus]|uniref:Transcriptional regulator WhiB n=1 Tax=Streptomyces pacificus TaxID=2705029 RepID=A0A6A0AUN8_9ACTN|nr:WhiB family transcriptional regulator [Streptomyces pacificus]GFH36586.1 transcriptional regulator WhiB [Streptomyces pacificus]
MAADLTGALCAAPGQDLAMWFRELEDTVDGRRDTRYARETCLRCPVRVACLDQQMEIEGRTGASSRHGVFGGLSGRERRRLYESAKRAKARAAA